ncbi:probable PMR1 - secretory pathway Ca++-transporting P-type ATPase [Melanopsichium pennsylvanicum]|uniref:Calcium-transporting ATPase n=2 Tax=Melanopsichium pennsylvanicum TaxID=63383 RepID=A0AAJ4XH20_9BASI|nr:probable PMR1-secretory pathway Ca-transporting P-type ATPase [Melanopsichium pennsylvanicum 4]SNX82008.1 probable PMR1 - secretory pathway Ca++-transporting P-type ATPase [Melanopsichium pennsylvanicum]
MATPNRYRSLPTSEYDLTNGSIPPSTSQLPPPDQFAFSTTLRKVSPDDPYTHTPPTDYSHASYPPFSSPPRPGVSHKLNASDSSYRHDATSIDLHHASCSSFSFRSTTLSASAHYTHLSVSECLEALHCPSLTHGLTPLLVHEARKEAGGYNEFSVRAGHEPWQKFLAQFQEPLILLLLGSAAVSLLIGQIDDAVSITIAIIIVISVAFYQEQKSEKSLEALNKLVPHYCHLVRDGVTSSVLANELVPGDVVTFSTGDRIPADVRIAECVSLELDESTLTGEIKPRRKHAHVVPSNATATQAGTNGINGCANRETESVTSINERENIAFMGTLVKSGHGRGIVVGTGATTEFGMIFSMVDQVMEKRTPLQLSMDELAKKLSMVSFGVIGVICLMGVWQRRPWLEMFTIGVSLAVAAIPEGLPIVVTVTLALGVLKMSHRNAIVKKLPSVETLGSVSVVCSDKTGTLTTNEMSVTKCWTAEDGILDVAQHMSHKHTQALSRMLLTGNVCNNSHRNEQGVNVGQATDVALVNILRVFGLEDQRPYFRRSNEVAFDSDTKCMAVTGSLSTLGVGEVVYVKGALEVVLEKSSSVLDAHGSPIKLDEGLSNKIAKAAQELSSQGLRVIAFASGSAGSLDTRTLTLSGLQAMQDPPRPGVKEAIASLARSGVQVIMITGDSEVTAVAMARQLGILSCSSSSATTSVLTGRQIDSLTERQLQERISSISVFARTTPRHKMSIISAFQSAGSVVAMTGDGVNDAPALKMADIGISMGKSGTDVAKEAADVILVDDNFSTILSAVEEGKGIFYNIQNFLSFQLSTAVAALILITLSTAFRLKLPLNAMQILFINILMDGPPSQSLGVDPVDRKSVMSRPPRRKDAPVLNKRLFYRIAFSATMVVFGTLYIYIHELVPADIEAPSGASGTGGKVADQRDSTMTFTCFVFLDLVSAIQNRGLYTHITANRMLGLTVSISLLAQLGMVYLPPLQGVFQTTGLAFGDLVLLACIAAISFGLHEVRRIWERRLAEEEIKDAVASGSSDWA